MSNKPLTSGSRWEQDRDNFWRGMEELRASQKKINQELKQIAEERQKEAEERRKEAEERRKEAEERRKEAEERRKEAEERRKEDEKRQKEEAEKKRKEDEKRQKEYDKSRKEYEERQRKSDQKLERIGLRLGGLQNNLGEIAEETFFQGLSEKKQIGTITFDRVSENVRDFDANEYDIVLQNGKYIAVVEVKQKLHPNNVDSFVTKKLPTFNQFKEQYQKTKGKHVIGVMAGMAVVPSAKKRAEQYGLYVLGQSGENIKEINSSGFSPTYY